MNILEKLKLTDSDIERLGAATGDFADPPDKTYCLVVVDEASAATSKAGNVYIKTVYKVEAFPTKFTGNYGSPRIWQNGGLLTHPGSCDITGQTAEYVEKLTKKVAMWAARLAAHGLANHGVLMSEDLTVADAEVASGDFIGKRLIAYIRVSPAGSTYTDKDGNVQTRLKTRIEVDRVEADTPENMAKRGIEAPPF